MISKAVAIHQPNFFPWLGYFDKIARADEFIFMDNVQFPKTGGVWSNRVKLMIGGEARWVTAAIDRNYSGIRQIREMYFLSSNPWRQKMLKSLESNYRKHPFYTDVMTPLESLIMNPESNIAEYNIYAVTEICKLIGLEHNKLRRSSEFETDKVSNELLCELTSQVGGTVYMCGGGADGYQDEQVFQKLRIQLKYQHFKHPEYNQYGRKSFTSGLSLIDSAMNLGWKPLANILSGT